MSIHTESDGLKYILHVHIARGGLGCILQVHTPSGKKDYTLKLSLTAGDGKGYTLHVNTAAGGNGYTLYAHPHCWQWKGTHAAYHYSFSASSSAHLASVILCSLPAKACPAEVRKLVRSNTV